jgi:hypothetical protein
MRIHLINTSDVSFGAAVITPRWLYVLAAATPRDYGDPQVIDETLEQIDLSTVSKGDVIGIGIHTLNALRGSGIGAGRAQHIVSTAAFTLAVPDEPPTAARAVVKGTAIGVADRTERTGRHAARVCEGGEIEGASMLQARWDLLPRDSL